MRRSALILCYHKVGPESEEGRRLNIEPRRLESHVRFFSRRRPVCRACDFADGWPAGAVCFTFDDAYASTMSNALAILERYGVRGSFYAVSGLVGKSSQWDGELARPLAPWEALREAQTRNHEIGNHTLSHPHLDQLDALTQLRETGTADQELRAEGIRPTSFCYPYGGLDATAIEAVSKCGYRVGLALRKRLAAPDDDLRTLPRIVVAFSDALPMLLYKTQVRPRLRRR